MAETIGTNQFKNGITLIHDGRMYQIIEFQHIKPGKGSAFVRTKFRDLKTGNVYDRTFRSGEQFELVYIEQHPVQYLYSSGDSYYFMDTETYEQVHIEKEVLADAVKFLKEGLQIMASYYQGRVMSVALPSSVELKIIHTEPGIKGDTARATYKPATLESGTTVQVPLFINNGDTIKVDTRTGEYLNRA